jgi:hypothetical protein
VKFFYTVCLFRQANFGAEERETDRVSINKVCQSPEKCVYCASSEAAAMPSKLIYAIPLDAVFSGTSRQQSTSLGR